MCKDRPKARGREAQGVGTSVVLCAGSNQASVKQPGGVYRDGVLGGLLYSIVTVVVSAPVSVSGCRTSFGLRLGLRRPPQALRFPRDLKEVDADRLGAMVGKPYGEGA